VLCAFKADRNLAKQKPEFMKKSFPEQLLNQPISELKLSDKFKELTHKFHYQTLGDILNLNEPYDLLKHEGFDYRILMEFTHILNINGLNHYLMPI
jgi:hypothetical protein